MKAILHVLLTWMLGGFGAVVGSILGNAAGPRGLFVGAIVGGGLATLAAALLARRLRLLAAGGPRGAAVGGLLGFAVAAPIAVGNLHTPVTPVLATALVGLGALLGDRYAASPALREKLTQNRGRLAWISLLLVLPAFVLVAGGLSGQEVPTLVVHPVLVMGGLLGALALSLLSVLQVRMDSQPDQLVTTLSLRLRGAGLNLVAFFVASALLATIAVYMFLENYQPRAL